MNPDKKKMIVVVASTNPVKINCTLESFQKTFVDESATITICSVSVPSGVADQPKTNKETLQGATNRALNAREVYLKDHPEKAQSENIFFVGIEGGIEDEGNDQVASFAYTVVVENHTQYISKAKTSTFYLPKPIIDLLREGKELGEADDIVFKKNNSKQQTGAVGLLTNELVTRSSYYEQAMILALIPFKNRELYGLP